MARKKKNVELPELPLGLNEEAYEHLGAFDTLSLILWIKNRKKQIINATIKKLKAEEALITKKKEGLQSEEQNLEDERTKIQEQLQQYSDENKKLEELEKTYTESSEKVRVYSEKKRISKDKIEELKTKNPTLFKYREKLHNIEKKQQNLLDKKKDYEDRIQSNNSSIVELQEKADAFRREDDEKKAKAYVKMQEKLANL